MRILLAIDGSESSRCATEAVIQGPTAPNTEVKVISVAQARIPVIPDPTMTGLAMHEESLDRARERATAAIAETMKMLKEKAPSLKLSQVMPEGSPKDEILDEAIRWDADLIVLGSHGKSGIKRFLLGSVSHSVMLHAPCSVEVVRPRANAEEAKK